MNTNYTFRKSVLEKPQFWELTEHGVAYKQESKNDILIPYDKVQSIRLLYLPNNRYRLNNYCCKITVNNRVFDINSCTYRSFATFDDQAETYVPFVKELVRKVKTANPNCILRTGQNPSTWYGNIIFVIIAALALFFLFHFFTAEFGKFFIVVKLLLIGYMAVYLAKSIKVNKPKQLEGSEIPDYVLPEAKTVN